MKRKITYTALLLVTLSIGFIIGFLVNGRLVRSKVQDLHNYYTPAGFHRQLFRTIEPTPEQIDQIKPILNQYAAKNSELLVEFKHNQYDLYEELIEELEPYLTEQQIERLQEMPRTRNLGRINQPQPNERREKRTPRHNR